MRTDDKCVEDQVVTQRRALQDIKDAQELNIFQRVYYYQVIKCSAFSAVEGFKQLHNVGREWSAILHEAVKKIGRVRFAVGVVITLLTIVISLTVVLKDAHAVKEEAEAAAAVNRKSVVLANLISDISLSPGKSSLLQQVPYKLIFPIKAPPTRNSHASTVLIMSSGVVLAAWFGGIEEGTPDTSIWMAERASTGTWSSPR
ncbi:hypothetical protein CYMTET_25849 [Cymbomonas tetramitiformis]|uniref:Uncharacterized protein n=1 Tax=Cymbomonas tetramitiformis TaxID=36881 RepID=A0AAE0KYM4_9CHLO|nr:hypothetical protein CYMTET_25849 [Cymbomonas tetramitiformis]